MKVFINNTPADVVGEGMPSLTTGLPPVVHSVKAYVDHMKFKEPAKRAVVRALTLHKIAGQWVQAGAITAEVDRQELVSRLTARRLQRP